MCESFQSGEPTVVSLNLCGMFQLKEDHISELVSASVDLKRLNLEGCKGLPPAFSKSIGKRFEC